MVCVRMCAFPPVNRLTTCPRCLPASRPVTVDPSVTLITGFEWWNQRFEDSCKVWCDWKWCNFTRAVWIKSLCVKILVFYTCANCTPLLLRVLAWAVARVKQRNPKYMHSLARWEQFGWSRKGQCSPMRAQIQPGFPFYQRVSGLRLQVCLSTW